MSAKPDRFALMLICEAGEMAGIDPEQVELLRSWVFERCQPKVKDVVEMAMRWREKLNLAWEHLLGFNHDITDEHIAFRRMICDSEGDKEGLAVCAKLLEMTPERRQMVASRVADKVRELDNQARYARHSEEEAQSRRIPAGTPMVRNPDGTYRRYGGMSADMVIIDDPIIRHGDRWPADPSTATPLDDIRWMRDQIRSNSIRVGVDTLIRADEAMLAWKRSQDPELKLEGQSTPGSIPPLLAMRLSRGRYYATRRLLESEILGEDFPSRLPAILDGLLRSLEAIEAGQNPATVL